MMNMKIPVEGGGPAGGPRWEKGAQGEDSIERVQSEEWVRVYEGSSFIYLPRDLSDVCQVELQGEPDWLTIPVNQGSGTSVYTMLPYLP